ncbi:MAG: hypothetical protein WAM85_06280 [Terracidiphilus sp.]
MAEKEIKPLPQDLLEQAQFLVRCEGKKPKQASLRRAVSTAYYAAFHLLGGEAARQASPTTPSGLKERVQRSLDHSTMKEAAKRFESQNLPDSIKSLVTIPMPGALVAVARDFISLQEERHKADCDLAKPFDRARAQNAVSIASRLFAFWNAVRDTDDARVFLASQLFSRHWSR